MTLKKKNNLYYAIFQVDGKKRWIKTGQTSRRAAEKIEKRLAAELEKERNSKQLASCLIDLAKQIAYQEIDKIQSRGVLAALDWQIQRQAMEVIEELFPAPAITCDELWQKYLDTKPQIKANTLRDKEIRFNKFSLWWAGRDIREVNELGCRQFLKSLKTSKSGTINTYITNLSSTWSAWPDIPNPWGKHLRLKDNSESKSAFSIDQINAILKYCREHNLRDWEIAVTTAFYTGLRMIDVSHLEKSELDGQYLDLCPEKTSRTRRKVRIQLKPELNTLLHSLSDNNQRNKYLLPRMAKTYDTYRRKLLQDFRDILTGSEIIGQEYGFHSLRHTFVTQAKEAGMKNKDIQAITGQADDKTMEIYYHGRKNVDLTLYPDSIPILKIS
jgi:integrase